MKHVQKYIGLDVSTETIAVSVADSGSGEPRYHGTILNQQLKFPH